MFQTGWCLDARALQREIVLPVCLNELSALKEFIMSLHALDLGVRLLCRQSPFPGLDVSVSPGNAIARYLGQGARSCLLSGQFKDTFRHSGVP